MELDAYRQHVLGENNKNDQQMAEKKQLKEESFG